MCEILSKVCKSCGVDKPFKDYQVNNRLKDGRSSKCRKCLSVNKKPTVKEGNKWCNCCKTEKPNNQFNVDNATYDKLTSNCKDCRNKSTRTWAANNPDKTRASRKIHDAKPNRRLQTVLRSRLGAAIKKHSKRGSAVSDLGCSINWFRDYMEWHFDENMSWDNWGKVWEIDHIVPLASFDLSDRDQLLIAVHYTNLQPLSVHDNRAKSDRLDWINSNKE